MANPCSPAVVDAMRTGVIGYIDTPAQGNKRPEGVAFCLDNGCFSKKWDEGKWWQFLADNAHDAATCLFAVAPDVVGDALATTRLFRNWGQDIRALGYPVAYVAQNGLEGLRGTTVDGGLTFPVPWESFDCLFLGGSLECLPCRYVYNLPRKPKRNEPCPTCGRLLKEWKLGTAAREIVAEAKARGKWVHMGRLNSERRYEYARAIGCDSADGTYLTFGPDVNLPKLIAWTRNNDQPDLFGESA